MWTRALVLVILVGAALWAGLLIGSTVGAP